jgi:Tol biopolymer transport system component/DNA-binding winged helix-turn-helix (wHTH) protein
VAVKYRWDDFVLDLDGFRLERGGIPLSLEPKAFNLLAMLVERPGHVFTKQEIFERIWPNTAVTDHALTRVVAQLRRVLGDEARDGRYIETVPTRGYRWLPKVEPVPIVPDSPRPEPSAAAGHSPSVTVPPIASSRRAVFPGLAFGLAVAIVLLGLAAWTQRVTSTERGETRVGPPRDLPWPVQLTAHAGLDLHPAFSPQGDAVAFASDRSGTFELYVRALAGPATEVALTSDGQQNVQPAWSPDGSLIAFHSYARGGVWVMPARGGAPRQVAVEGSHPAWSFDGQRIAFQSDEPSDVTPSAFGAQGGSTIRVVDVDGGNARQLTNRGQPLGGHSAPAWTRDGRFVAFTVFEGARSNGVWLVSVESGKTTQLLEGRRGNYELAFAPDDSAIYVAGGDPFVTRLPFDKQAGTLAGQREMMAVPGVAGVRGISMSPDGRTLGIAGLSVSSQLWAQPIAPDGTGRGEARALTTDTSRRNSKPVVSADGSRVVYVSIRGGEPPNVWVIGVDGTGGAQVTTNDSPDLLPYWFPDGRRIAFVSTREQGMGLWSVDLETRREELMLQLTDVASKVSAAANGTLTESSLSRSMSKLAMDMLTPPFANRQVFITSTATLEPRPLSDPAQWVGYPAWSPDERQLAVEIKNGSSTHAGVLDAGTGALRQLTNERGQTWIRSWSPDGKRIAAAVFRRGLWDLRWIDAESGAMGVITAPAPPRVYMRYPEWSPRGDLVVFERGELRGNVWMLRLPER